jgi:hypothetical protein
MVTELPGIESAPMRRARLLRFELAAVATASSVCSAAAAEAMDGGFSVLGPVIAAASVAYFFYRLPAGAHRLLRWSAEQLALLALAVPAGVLVWTYSEEWRLTATAIAVTAPNWFVLASNLMGPPRPRLRTSSSNS